MFKTLKRIATALEQNNLHQQRIADILIDIKCYASSNNKLLQAIKEQNERQAKKD